MENKNDLNICSICNKNYDFDKRLPKKLNCSHTFCLNCLKERKKEKKDFDCPSCNAKIEENPHKLKDNKEILLNLKKENKDFGICTICTKNYDYDDRLPKKLNCSHTFCLKCLEKWKREKEDKHKDFDCFVCRKKIEKKPINLDDNKEIKNFVKTYNTLFCLKCEKEKDLINFFIDNDDDLKIKCKNCINKKKNRLLNILNFYTELCEEIKIKLNEYLQNLKLEINNKLFKYIKKIIINNLQICKNIDYENIELKLLKIKENLKEINEKFSKYEEEKNNDIFKIFPYENCFKKIKNYQIEIEEINKEFENIKNNINFKDKNLFPDSKDIKDDIIEQFKSDKINPNEIVQKCIFCEKEFDDDKKIPKIFPSCKHILCRECLLNQYNESKTIKCYCNKISSKNPKDLYTYEKYFKVNKFVECLHCRKRIRREELYFDDENNELICINCIKYKNQKNKNKNYKTLKESISDFNNNILKNLILKIDNIIKGFDNKIKNELIGNENYNYFNNDSNNNIKKNNFFDTIFDKKFITEIEKNLNNKIKKHFEIIKNLEKIQNEINKIIIDENSKIKINENEKKNYEEKVKKFSELINDSVNNLKNEKEKISNYIKKNLEENYLLINKNNIIIMISELFRKNIKIETKKNNILSIIREEFSIINLKMI